MIIHLVGGFLGSGKTTAIVNACLQLIESGKKVGVITNDQGKYLVDTAFVSLKNIPAVEVTGGCFCCNYQQLDQNIDALIEEIHPDIIFAESVGSCADMVSTVMNPLLKFGKQKLIPGSLSVFTDCRLLLRRLRGELLPFSNDVSYIFDQQLEEAGVVVMNKIDLLNSLDLYQLEILAAEKWPQKIRLMSSALSGESIQGWLSLIGQRDTKNLGNSIDLDYSQYASGETKLAWLDQTITITSESPNIRSEIVDLIQSMIAQLDDVGAPIGHLKFLFISEHTHTKVSITTQHSTDWESQIPALIDGLCKLIINARVEIPSPELEKIMSRVIENSKLPLHVNDSAIFYPLKPTPTYRLNY